MRGSHPVAKLKKSITKVRGILAWITFTLLAALCTVPAMAGQQPNIITIITDDQGWADIGYNNPKVYTPHLDALAAESAVCTRHYSMPPMHPHPHCGLHRALPWTFWQCWPHRNHSACLSPRHTHPRHLPQGSGVPHLSRWQMAHGSRRSARASSPRF
jgi:hypothetical protein